MRFIRSKPVVSLTVTTSAFGRNNNNCYNNDYNNNYGLLSTFRLNLNARLKQKGTQTKRNQVKWEKR